jgi:hypothetical protein
MMLVYTEGILIMQYVYQIPTRLHCAIITPRLQALVEEAGLHGNALRCIPIFCVYLATLMHTYSLARQKVLQLVLSLCVQGYARCSCASPGIHGSRTMWPTLSTLNNSGRHGKRAGAWELMTLTGPVPKCLARR